VTANLGRVRRFQREHSRASAPKSRRPRWPSSVGTRAARLLWRGWPAVWRWRAPAHRGDRQVAPVTAWGAGVCVGGCVGRGWRGCGAPPTPGSGPDSGR